MSKQGAEFGRRGVTRPVPVQVAADVAGSPLVRQIGGILFGVAIAFALGAAGVFAMKFTGRQLGQNFLEQATPGAPKDAIKQITNPDSNLTRIQQTCAQRAKDAELTKAQRDATEGYMSIYSGESELADAAAFIQCLAESQPARFCQAPDRKHLVEALRQYAKLNRQMVEAWSISTGGMERQRAVLMGAPARPEQRVRLGLPSSVMSPSMVSALRTLAADGHVAIRDLSALTANGLPPQLKEALADIRPKKAMC
jgi:hypothetical protein